MFHTPNSKPSVLPGFGAFFQAPCLRNQTRLLLLFEVFECWTLCFRPSLHRWKWTAPGTWNMGLSPVPRHPARHRRKSPRAATTGPTRCPGGVRADVRTPRRGALFGFRRSGQARPQGLGGEAEMDHSESGDVRRVTRLPLADGLTRRPVWVESMVWVSPALVIHVLCLLIRCCFFLWNLCASNKSWIGTLGATCR